MEFVKSSFAHADEFEISLAQTDAPEAEAAVNAGIKLAKSGNWQAAKQQWQNALTAAPNNDAALYNLGVAHEATSEFRQAASLYHASLSVNDNHKYREALGRVQRSQQNYHAVMAQINGAGNNPHGTFR